MARRPQHGSRGTREVFEAHLRLAAEGCVEEDLALNYATDCVAITGWGIFRGHEGLRSLADELQQQAPCGSWTYLTRQVHGPIAFLEWSAYCPGVEIHDGADSFFIQEGRIVVQTIHYTVERLGQNQGLQREPPGTGNAR